MSKKRCSVCLDLMEVFGYSRKEKHTIYQCPKCGNREILRDADVSLPIHTQTFFDCITTSPEVLAEEFVEIMYNHILGDSQYFSMLTYQWYTTREAAIAATVANLKEVVE